MVNPNQIGIMLVGNSEEGKTSLGMSLKHGSPHANHISTFDRTEGFDIYDIEMEADPGTEEMVVHLCDIGGQDDYNLVVPVLSRNHSLSLLIVSCTSLSFSLEDVFMNKMWFYMASQSHKHDDYDQPYRR